MVPSRLGTNQVECQRICLVFVGVPRMSCPGFRSFASYNKSAVIIRTSGDELLLIQQIDHAALAERLIAAWQPHGFPDSPTRAEILFATRRHDDGWIDEDAAPLVDPATGGLLD